MRQTTGIIILEGLTGLVLLIGLGLALVAWRLTSGPTDLAFVKGEIENALTEARGGDRVTIDDVSLRWENTQNEFQVFAEGLEFYSEDEELVARSQSALIDVRALGLLSGKVQLRQIEIDTGELMIRRDSEGAIWLAGERIPPARPLQFHEASSIIQYLEQSILNVVDNISESAAVSDLRAITLSNFTVHLIDDQFDIDWTLEQANLRLERTGEHLDIAADGAAYGAGSPDAVYFELAFEPAKREFDAFLRLDQAKVFELPVLTSLDLPIDGDLTADLAFAFGVKQTGVEGLSLDSVTQGGMVSVAGYDMPIGRNDLGIIYDVEANKLVIDARDFEVGPARGDWFFELDDVVGLIEAIDSTPFDLSWRSDRLELDLTPMFPNTWRIQDINLAGALNFAEQRLDFSNLSLAVDGTTVSSSGRLYRARSQDHPEDLPFGVMLTAEASGAVPPQTVLDFWPVELGTGARDWLVENLLDGRATEGQIKLDIAPDSLRNGYLDDEDLQLDFSFEEGVVTFLEDLPAVMNGYGTGQLKGNSFSLDLASANFSDWELERGTVSIPYFMPKGEDMLIEAEGTGEVIDILRTLSNSRLQLEAEYSMPIEDISGTGRAKFSLQRPALSDVPYEETIFNVSGTVREGRYDNLINDMDLSARRADITIDNEVVRVVGRGRLDEAAITFDWSDNFRSEAPDSTQLEASGIVSPDMLNDFGIAVRAYMTGDATAIVKAEGVDGVDFSDIDVGLDLENTRIEVPEIDWIKPVGSPATANIKFENLKETNETDVEFNADGVAFRGNVMLTEQGRLDRLDVNRLFVRDQVEMTGELRRTDPVSLELDVTGPYLNLEGALQGLLGGGNDGALPLFGNIDISADFDQIRLRDGVDISAASLDAIFAGPVLNFLDLAGALNDVDPFALEIRSNDDDSRSLNASVSNAGGLLTAMFGGDIVKGGELSVTGTLRDGESRTDLNINIRNTRLANAPLLTQILSLASLRGLADVMAGDGILFSSVNVPLMIDNSGYYIPGAKASGPALGFTAKGSILDGGKDLTLDGVLVPSFGTNSALGGIPIIGDLFVSRDGEGVFAITYSVRGSIEEARIAVNPLSGILPGMLRRIFENPDGEALTAVPPEPQ